MDQETNRLLLTPTLGAAAQELVSWLVVQPGKYNTSEGVPFQAGSTQVSASTACRNCKFKFVKFPLKFPSLALDSGSAALNTTVPSYKRARCDMLSDYSPAQTHAHAHTIGSTERATFCRVRARLDPP